MAGDDRSGPPKGMVCPCCRSADHKRITRKEARRREDGEVYIRRTMSCSQCRSTWSTVEFREELDYAMLGAEFTDLSERVGALERQIAR